MTPLEPVSDQLDDDQPSRRTKTRYEKDHQPDTRKDERQLNKRRFF